MSQKQCLNSEYDDVNQLRQALRWQKDDAERFYRNWQEAELKVDALMKALVVMNENEGLKRANKKQGQSIDHMAEEYSALARQIEDMKHDLAMSKAQKSARDFKEDGDDSFPMKKPQSMKFK